MKSLIIIFFILVFNYNFLLSQQWQYLGLGTESITTIAVDWSNPNIIYAGSGSDFSAGTVGGIFKSTNGGASWDTLIRGVTARTIVIHPTNPNIIYATLGINFLTSAGIIKSANAGITWVKADSGIEINPEVGPGPFAMDFKNPDTIYTATSGFFGGKFYRSLDGGMSWHSLGDSTRLRNGVTAIAINPNNTNVIYTTTEFSGDLLKSTDNGISWSVILLDSINLSNSIEFSKNNLSTLYVGSGWTHAHPVGLFKTTDSGLTWEHPTKGLPDTANIDAIQVSDLIDEKIFIVANWRDGGGIYENIGQNEWKRIGINNKPIKTIKLAKQKLYVSCHGIYVMDVPTYISNEIILPPQKI